MADLQETFGTRRQELAGYLGNKRGPEAFAVEQLGHARMQVEAHDVATSIEQRMHDLSDHQIANRIAKIPILSKYLGNRGAAGLTHFARRLGLSRDQLTDADQQRMFHAVESIRELDTNGNPVFGTSIYRTDPKTGARIKDANGNDIVDRPRYTAAQGQQFWNDMTPNQQKVVKWLIEEQKVLAQQAGIDQTVEGYIHHYFDKGFNGFLRSLTSKKYRLARRTASARFHRTEKPGFVEHFEKAAQKSWTELAQEKVWNDMMSDLVPLVTDPIPKTGELHPGWVEIPKTQLTRRGKFIGNLAGGRQIPAPLYREWKQFIEPVEELHATRDAIRSFLRFTSGTLLAYPGTIFKNFIGSSVQWATFVTDSLAHGIMAGGNFKPFMYAVYGPLDALMPDTIHALSDPLIGGRSNLVGQNMEDNPGLGDRINSVMLLPIGAIDNWVKRAIAVAHLRAQGIKIDRDTILAEKKAFAAMRQAVDTWGLDYDNLSTTLKKMKANPIAPLLSLFPTYPYKAAQMLGHYFAAPFAQIEPDPRFPGMGNFRERAARLLTAGMIMGLLSYMFWPRPDDEDRSPLPGGPPSVSTSGRLKFGSTKEGKERWASVADIPWFNLQLLLNAGTHWKRTGVMPTADMLSTIGSNVPHTGPLFKAIELASVASSEKQASPVGVTAARLLKPFIPYGRLIEGIKERTALDWHPPFVHVTQPPAPLLRSQTFMQEFSKIIPGLPTRTAENLFGLGKLVIDPVSKQPVIKDPSLESFKFWTGMNITEIDPAHYDITKMRLLRSASVQLKKAKTWADAKSAFSTIKQLDPELADDLKDMIPEKKIGLTEQQRELYDTVKEAAAP